MEIPGMKIVTCDVTKSKDKRIFFRSIEVAKTTPQRVIVVGDSWTSDVMPAIDAGVPIDRIIRMGTKYGLSNNDKVHGVRQIDSVAYIEDAVFAMN